MSRFGLPFSHSRVGGGRHGHCHDRRAWTRGGIARRPYGAYKDSPHESFLLRRFLREIVIALAVALGLTWVPGAHEQSMFVLYLSTFALTRTVTEFWKLFVRVEQQAGFRIPTQIHCVTGIVHNPVLRLVLGFGFLASI